MCEKAESGKSSPAMVLLLALITALPAEAQPPIKPSPYWKNQITFPDDPFRVSGTSADDPGWVKFTILLLPYNFNVVYFQDCRQYKFHYDFANELLDPFVGMTRQQYDRVTLFSQGQKALLGAVVLPPISGWPKPITRAEYGIQIVRQDPYSREEIEVLFNIVKTSITAEPNVTAFYFPTYEQMQVAEANRDWFASRGIPVGSTAQWAEGNQVYSSGWAIGQLKYFEPDLIEDAYVSGELEPNDILLTDGVPAEVPFVAGIISLSPSTPNSHVAILASNYGVPFVHLAVAEAAERARGLVGHRIVLRAFEGDLANDVRLIDVDGVLDETEIAEILALKEPPPLDISAMEDYGSYGVSTDGLEPDDIKYFGGKAANFGILRTSIPHNSPVAAAFSFRLWSEFLDQQLISGRTLREQIDSRLLPYTYPPADLSALVDDLEIIREMFEDPYYTHFSEAQADAVVAILQDPQYGFDPARKIRFRSSTNVEDSNQTTFAGLFDSYSGCLADELDGNESGPCICDNNEPDERGVFLAIRKVFASFYNDNAFLERLRYGVNEAEVGMALLVHHSFPDEIELANGVATLRRPHGSTWNIKLVTQLGAISVTNPADGAIPEEVNVNVYSFGTYPTLVRQSNLVPLGAAVMDWQDDYLKLSQLLTDAAERFYQVTGTQNTLLDLEYNKIEPDGKLVLTQIRRVPQPDATATVTPFLINQPLQLCTFQGEYGDVFANHRLKSRWLVETKNTWLTTENLADCFYTTLSLEYADAGRIRTVSGTLELWPRFAHLCDADSTIDSWLMHHLSNPRTCSLRTDNVPTAVTPAQNPMLTVADFSYISLQVDYARPVPTWTWTGPGTTTSESIRLHPDPPAQPAAGEQLQQRTFQGEKGVLINTAFYWPRQPVGATAGYTAPLVRWLATTIEGYTSEPIVLTGWYAQTYRPEHHNFGENFLFEPQLQPGIPTEMLDQLRQRDIKLIHVRAGYDQDPIITTWGFDEEPFLAGDIDADGDVDFPDFDALARRWLDSACHECDGADLTGDARVNAEDLAELADNWLDNIQTPAEPG